jgi:hypothetical protein
MTTDLTDLTDRMDRTGSAAGSAAGALDLIDRSRCSLTEAYAAQGVAERYLAAQLAALRAAAALLAVPTRRRSSGPSSSGPRNIWELTAAAAPDLAEWAGYFAHSTRQRADVEQGRRRVARREADDLLRSAEAFLDLVTARLGLPTRAADHPERLLPAHGGAGTP